MKSILERFLAKIVINGNGCWEWTAALFVGGYGQFFWGNKMGRAHRFAYEVYIGPIPSGLTIDHLCRNRACVNPEHLEVVTGRENTLRGIGITAQEARRTHCPKGHPYNLFNTYYRPKGWRECRICAVERTRKFRDSEREDRKYDH